MVALVETILVHSSISWSGRRIAWGLGVYRDGVARYLLQAGVAITPTGLKQSKKSKLAIAPSGSEAVVGVDLPVRTGPGRPSDCAPW